MRRLVVRPCSMLFASVALTQPFPADAAGEKDHPLLTRHARSWRVASEARAFDAARLPGDPTATDFASVEGQVTQLFNLAPAGCSVPVVQRNYEQALERAGTNDRSVAGATLRAVTAESRSRQDPQAVCAKGLPGEPGRPAVA